MKYCIVLTSTYPSHKLSEVTDAFRKESKEQPPDTTHGQVIAHLGQKTSEGYKTIFIWEPAEGKLETALDTIALKQVEFYNGIEGYETSLEVWTDIESVDVESM